VAWLPSQSRGNLQRGSGWVLHMSNHSCWLRSSGGGWVERHSGSSCEKWPSGGRKTGSCGSSRNRRSGSSWWGSGGEAVVDLGGQGSLPGPDKHQEASPAVAGRPLLCLYGKLVYMSELFTLYNRAWHNTVGSVEAVCRKTNQHDADDKAGDALLVHHLVYFEAQSLSNLSCIQWGMMHSVSWLQAVPVVQRW